MKVFEARLSPFPCETPVKTDQEQEVMGTSEHSIKDRNVI